MEVPSWATHVLALLVATVLPFLISYVATSTSKILNWAIALSSSAAVGLLTAWIGGQFTTDIWLNLTIAISATQTAYIAYWKDKIASRKTGDVEPSHTEEPENL